MEKLTEIISKKIYCLGSGNGLGYVLNAVFDENLSKIKSLIVVDEESELEGCVETKFIKNSTDCFFVENQSCLFYGVDNNLSNPIGKRVFTKNGTDWGKIKEVLLNNFKVEAFVTDKLTFAPKQISVWGNDAIIIGKKKKSFDNIQQKPVFHTNHHEEIVSIMSSPQIKEVVATPYRISTDAKNLIGKMATRDIFGLNNELIIKKFEIITQKKLNEAKKHNKLNILFYNCK